MNYKEDIVWIAMADKTRRDIIDMLYKKDIHPVEFAAWTHAEFVKIHPFKDGNGRTARMIMNYQLLLNGWLPVSVNKDDRLNYYNALESYAVLEDINPFVKLIAELENKELVQMIEIIRQITKQ